ncbi:MULTISPECIES: YicC/YloC family endoribonuclease [unclassified Nitrospina]|uniref:YicC/YloC family endoribonuclease n=1 Tax=unclassified Nitrospina TaxID=2638683 RepID=UPI003F9C1015
MLKSMTGFGRSEKQSGTFSCKVEIRSVNNRFIEANTRLPKHLNALELPLKKCIKARCARGSFDVYVSLERSEGEPADQKLKPNIDLASQYVDAARQLKEQFGLSGDLPLEALLGVRDILVTEQLELDPAQESMVMETVEDALTALIQMRTEEGANLEADLDQHIRQIGEHLETIKERQPMVLEAYQERLKDKLRALTTSGPDLDETRLAQEVAIMADRSDISEEISRLHSHLGQFKELLGSKEPAGRKLEFITQEINRETNTIGSKSADYPTSQAVIEIKSVLEKIREQLQNIE